jgi:hypothetical protein
MRSGEGSIVAVLVIVLFMINVKYPFMPPFTNRLKFDSAGQAIVMTREESLQKKIEEADRAARLKKEAEEIKAAYAQAYKDCNAKSWEKYGSTSAISVEFAFNSYDKTCYKTTMTGDLTKGTEGLYRDNFKITYETEFVRSELRDYMLVYRQ